MLYLPTDALHAEIARIPGLIDAIGREHRVLIMGPTLFPALLRTIHLGFVTLALEDKADEIRDLLGATRTEMLKMDDVLERLARQAGAFSGTIERARVRTRAVGGKLRGLGAVRRRVAGGSGLPGTDGEAVRVHWTPMAGRVRTRSACDAASCAARQTGYQRYPGVDGADDVSALQIAGQRGSERRG